MKRLLATVTLLVLLIAACQPRHNSGAAPPTSHIENKGSDTMVNLALAWAETYQAAHSDVEIAVTGGGSGTGLAALVNQTVDIANASRAIKPEEMAEAEAQGLDPIEFVVARDAIAVVVHPDNPVQELTFQQLSDIYSGKINNWKVVGGEDRPIVRLSREINSGTHVYFLETVIRQGRSEPKVFFSTDTLLLPSSEGIISEVRENPNAIGYDGLGYVPDDLKLIAVSKEPGGPFVLPSVNTVLNDTYPIARDLYMYTPGEPTGAVRDYLDWILSPEAQAIVAEQGFVPIAPAESSALTNGG